MDAGARVSSPGRAAALAARLETERGRRLDRAFGKAVRGLDRRERAFAHELAYGTTRLRGRLDHLLAPHVHRGLASVDEVVLEILRLGAYQALYMDSVPPYAAVSASVDQVRSQRGGKPAGFVNAVLRRVVDRGDGPQAFPDELEDPLAFMVAWGSHPMWLLERWLERWPAHEVRRLVEADNARPAVCLVPLAVEPGRAAALLGEAGVGASVVGRGSACVRLHDSADVEAALSALPDAIVQDPAANLVVRYADVSPGTIVADLCAAPGGKALALSDRSAEILAADRSEPRMQMVKDNARRTGRPLHLVVADALRPPVGEADVVLLDAPCTGTGTLARHPDARWRLRPESPREMAELQGRMLEAAAKVVRDGGLLVYSTCTLEVEENEGAVSAFLKAHPEFGVEATDAVPSGYLDPRGRLEVLPQSTGFDGAFAARMRKVA